MILFWKFIQISATYQRETTLGFAREQFSHKKEQAASINKIILKVFNTPEITYTSVNTILNQDNAIDYPVEILN